MPNLEKALEIRGDFTDAHWNLALCLLSLGDFERGWLEHEWRRRLPADAAQQRVVPLPQPEWNGCGISGRTVLVSTEQGPGDTLVKFVRTCRCCYGGGGEQKVIVECQPGPARAASNT